MYKKPLSTTLPLLRISDCLPEAGDIVTLPMKSVSLVVAYSSMLFPKLFHSPALPRAPSIAYRLSVDWHHSKRCVYLCKAVHLLHFPNFNWMSMYKLSEPNVPNIHHMLPLFIHFQILAYRFRTVKKTQKTKDYKLVNFVNKGVKTKCRKSTNNIIAFTFCTWSHVATAWTDIKTVCVWVHNMIYSDAHFQ